MYCISLRGWRKQTFNRLILIILLFGPFSVGIAFASGWTDVDVGSPVRTGSAVFTNGVWTVSGGGADIWSAADQFNFVSQPFGSDGSIIAKVTSLQNTDPSSGWSRAGVMFRNDTTAGSGNVAVMVSAKNGVEMQWRDVSGDASNDTGTPGINAPVWLQLVRSANNYTGYYSVDGTTWVPLGTVQLPLNGQLLAGMAVTAHNNAALNTATFTNVNLSPQTFGVYREIWTNLNQNIGNTLAMLTNTTYNPNWPNNPVASYSHVFTNFETEINDGVNYYGQRVRAFIVPPVTGAYTFWIASDDTSELLISSGESPASLREIASVPGYTASEQWTSDPNQQSNPINLQAGSRYFIEALMEQGTGGDNLAVRWQLPNGTYEQPMSAFSPAGTVLIPFTGVNTQPGIYSQSTNTTVVENQNATFDVLVTNQAPVAYQWFVGGNKIAGAAGNQAGYTLSNASLTLNNGQIFTCVISNSIGAVTSAPIVLTVVPDTAPPAVLRVFNTSLSSVSVVFSKGVTTASATDLANYALTNGLAITGASLAADNVTVTLATAPLTYYSNYSITINGVLSRAATPVAIAANTLVSFTASPYISVDIGSPTAASTTVISAAETSVTAGGTGTSGINDQFNFQYQTHTGNFDVTTRLEGLSLADVWSEAGLMARASLNPNAPFTASLATPGMAGCFFQDRATAQTTAVSAGTFPVNYPNTWLRLKRLGAQFSGFASYDGQTWFQLGTASIVMTDPIYVGFVTAGCGTNQSTAQFINFSNTSPSVVVGTQLNPHEPVGPSSRKSPITFSEIMYKPAPRDDSYNCEFVEIYNSQPFFHDISGYQITCADMQYTFPAGTIIPGGGYLVVAASPESITAVYGVTNVMGPYTGSLKKSETLELIDEHGALLLSAPYTATAPWPVAANGTGHSIVLADPTYGEGDARAWDISDIAGGSPGAMESYRPSPLRNVFIDEILAHSENPAGAQFVKLYNHSTLTVDLSGCILTDDTSTNQFVIPAGTTVPPHGFVSFNSALGFNLNPAGDIVYFLKPDNSRILDSVQFTGQADGVSYGRWPDGANDFYPLQTPDPATNNSPIVIGNIVINELMYKPISGNDDDQYVELYNQGTNAVSLANWQFTAGVTYTFPTNATIAPNGYLVVGKNTARLFANYPNLNSQNTFGNYSGKLSHDGERVALSMPQSLNGTNTIYVVEDEVTYGTGGRWGQWSSGGGSSLELIDPHANHRLAANWADSDETQKSQWTDIENTGVLDNGQNFETNILHAQVGLLDVGECLVDNVEVDFNSTNCVRNSTFETGFANWSATGDHVRSSLEQSGYQSGISLHLRCSDKFFDGDNSCQATLFTNTMTAGNTATLRFKARWLHGWPEVLLRLNGNWLEATAALPIPANLGTPGAPNSARTANAGPAIYQVTHTPTLPAANQAVVVTARVHDPDGVQSVKLYYRIDPGTGYNIAIMNDNGLSGDAIAGDGIFSATIPGRVANTITAFYVQATDKRGAITQFPALRPGNNEPLRECVIMFGDSIPGGSFGTYHLWITQTNINRWTGLSDLSNEGNDFTFVNDHRVIYNAEGHFAGSPYHQDFDTPVGGLCHYKWIFPGDDAFLGATDFNKIHQPGNGPGDDGSMQREQTANTFLRALGVPWLNRRYVAVYANGNRRGGLMEDAQVPNGDKVKENFPNDSDGFLYKMQPWFEFAPLPSGSTIGFNNNAWCNLLPFTTTGGVKKVARYRWNFEIRRTPTSDSDFTNIFSLVDAANSFGTPNYVANLENIADMENWMRVFAANHAAGNWDSFGAQNSQNLYGYIGSLGTKYSLMMWDFNIVIGNSGSWGPGQNLFTINGEDPNMANIYNTPAFLRMYWRALQELVNGPLATANTAPLVNAKYNAFVNDGLTAEDPNSAMLPWIAAAQSSIAAQLSVVNAKNFSVNSTAVVSNDTAYVTGTAPVGVDTVWINGEAVPITWITLTNWTAIVPLAPGTNQLAVTGVDIHNQPVPGATATIPVVYHGTAPSPIGNIVINEIMYNPVIPEAQYVELYNNSRTNTFDLSAWRLDGLDYTFPPGSLLGPTNFIVLAANSTAFAAAYGATTPVFDIFAGTLATNGLSTLALVEPQTPGDTIVAEVQFDSAPPWPATANGLGSSLQLIDTAQDNWRVANWAAVPTNGGFAPKWVFASATGTATSSLLYIYLQSAGDVYVDDVQLVAGSVPGSGANLLADGDFESGFPGTTWTVAANLANSALSTMVKHSGNASLHVVSTSAGTTQGSAIWQYTPTTLTGNATYTISYWYLQSTNGGPLTVRLSGSGIVDTANIAPPPTPPLVSPDAPNGVATVLPPFQQLWINEVQAVNLTGITTSTGQHAPWVEVYNPTASAISLSGLYLGNDPANPTGWAFPTNGSIAPGQFLVVFADGQSGLSTASELHTSFTLAGPVGFVALARLDNGVPEILDYLNYSDLPANYSYGSYPDGQSFNRQAFFYATPGGANDGGIPPAVPYFTLNSLYSQNFDSLPDPGAGTVNSDSPVTIDGITYAPVDPLNFAAPVSAGGLGLSLTMPGWYGLAGTAMKLGASAGDQSTGGIISFGTTGGNSTNRALGLLATSSSGSTAFGLSLINETTNVIDQISLSYAGELWRQQPSAKTLSFSYYLDPTGTNIFAPIATIPLPALDVNFPTGNYTPEDGTQPANQIELGVTNQTIVSWSPGAVLWLVWQITNNAGNSQGLAIDNLAFSADSVPVPPLILSQPLSQFNFAGGTITLSVTADGTSTLSYQWQLNGGNLADATNNTLVLNNLTAANQGVYDVQISDASGVTTSQPANVTVVTHSFVPYTSPGAIYTQNFDSLPDPGTTSVNAANPVTISGGTYSLSDPLDFAFPVQASGSGGLGLAATMSGWYGDAELIKLGASAGDQTTGGIISFGPTAGPANRALGLLATSTTGPTAFAMRVLNQTPITLNSLTLAFTGELWRQQATAKTLACSYYVDPTGAKGFSAANITAPLPALNVSFPTGSQAAGGTAPLMTSALGVTNQPITNCPPGAALWLVWQMTSAAGSGQGLAIDNLSFSATGPAPVLSITTATNGITLSWPAAITGYTLQYNASVTDPNGWQSLPGSNTTNAVTLPLTNIAEFYRLKL